MTAVQDELWRALSQAEELKLFPAAALEIHRIATLPSVTFRDLEGAVVRDPTLAARVLRMANSPFYALSCPVASVGPALRVLGFREVRDLALALALANIGSSARPGRAERYQHAMRAGTRARSIARVCAVDSGEAFAIGVLHDIGLSVMLEIEESRTLSLLALGEGACDQELAMFGYTHAELGAAILRQWNLPRAVCDAVARHHAASGVDGTPTGSLVALLQVCHVAEWSGEYASNDERAAAIVAHPGGQALKLRADAVRGALDAADDDLSALTSY